VLVKRDYFRDVISRAYYAMFYAAKAAVMSMDLEASKHSAVISLFGQHFAKSGRIPAGLHKSLKTAFDERQLADYTLDWPVSREVAEARLREAEQFVAAVASMLNLQP